MSAFLYEQLLVSIKYPDELLPRVVGFVKARSFYLRPVLATAFSSIRRLIRNNKLFISPKNGLFHSRLSNVGRVLYCRRVWIIRLTAMRTTEIRISYISVVMRRALCLNRLTQLALVHANTKCLRRAPKRSSFGISILNIYEN